MDFTFRQQVDLFAGTVLQSIALDDWQPDVRKVAVICTIRDAHKIVVLHEGKVVECLQRNES